MGSTYYFRGRDRFIRDFPNENLEMKTVGIDITVVAAPRQG